jgi:broad specificity phosphatase PhoE
VSAIWLIRHGESQSNAGELTPSAEGSALTAIGRAQARAAAAAIPRAPDLVVHTPYRRTGLTALPLLERFPNVALEEWPLQEFTYLEPDRYRNTTLLDRIPEKDEYWRRCEPTERRGPGAESFVDFVDRIDRGIERLRATRGFVVVFCHGHVMRAILMHLLLGGLGRDREAMRGYDHVRRAIEIPNGGLLELQLDPDQTRIAPLRTLG